MFDTKNYTRTKYEGLDGKVTVGFQENSGLITPFEIRATRTGLNFRGTMAEEISTEHDLQEFARFLSDCWAERRRFVPKLSIAKVVEEPKDVEL